MSTERDRSCRPVPGSVDAWLERLLETPGLTAISDPAEARRVHLEESLAALPFVERYPGPVVDVGSGGGAPGLPIAAALPDREVVLLEATRRKCDFLEAIVRDLPNVRVVCGRAEEQEIEQFGVAIAKALAPPPVAAEWCLPLVAAGGAAILFVGPSADAAAVGPVSAQLGGGEPEEHPGLLVLPKVAPTPAGFPRRAGVARKRPLA
jgi:16S rRNA (guanine527-N7)-methyltransferase